MSLKPAQLKDDPVPKNNLTLQVMKNPAATADHKNPHSCQSKRTDHVENVQEDRKKPL